MFFAIPSIEALRSLVASKDAALAEQLVAEQIAELKDEFGAEELDEGDQEEFDEMLDEFKADVASMIMSDTPPDREPGAWNFILRRLISRLMPEAKHDLPINKGYKHFYVWEPYQADIAGQLSPEAIGLLKHLDQGRPLQGTALTPDGTQFSWLTPHEVEFLRHAISAVNTEGFNSDLHEFHEDLSETLELASTQQYALLMVAH